MAGILRGDVRWADLNPLRGSEQAGKRPILVLCQDIFNNRSRTVIAVVITSQHQKAGFPLTLEIKSVRMPKQSWIKISQIRTLDVERIDKKIGRANPQEIAKVIDGSEEIIGA
jgi:mRNA interferase MazF